jgi:membrane-bound metal-dependent hydrolase YbcI (DUF457 family)
MDNVTHTLFGLTLARTRLGRAGRGTTAAFVLASNAPDIDIMALSGGTANYLHWHRGPTHGVLGIAGLGVATAGLVWTGRRLLDSRRSRVAGASIDPAPNASFGALVGVSIIGVLLHVLMDLPTSYGTRLLTPFDWHWYTTDWIPIVDIYLLAILGAGLIFGRGSEEARRQNVAIALVLMSLDYSLRAVSHHEALAAATRIFGPTLPAACGGSVPQRTFVDLWPRAGSEITDEPGSGADDTARAHRCLIDLAAIPDALSPFRWRLIAQTSNAYQTYDLNLFDRRFRRAAPDGALWRLTRNYRNEWTPAVLAASTAATARIFLGFARFADVRTIVDPGGATTVQWTDMRFIRQLADERRGPRAQETRQLPAVGGVDPVSFFSTTVRVGADGTILDEHLGP